MSPLAKICLLNPELTWNSKQISQQFVDDQLIFE